MLNPFILSALFNLFNFADPILFAAFLFITNSPGVNSAGTVSSPDIDPPLALPANILCRIARGTFFLSELRDPVDIAFFNSFSVTDGTIPAMVIFCESEAFA